MPKLQLTKKTAEYIAKNWRKYTEEQKEKMLDIAKMQEDLIVIEKKLEKVQLAKEDNKRILDAVKMMNTQDRHDIAMAIRTDAGELVEIFKAKKRENK
ncbi:MAG: hypothetical protein KC736_01095 [Candidatus Moranbacteria bacterium]|nr:hypothetical protein [Candidatus Moranbacteria bacterium]